MELARARAQSKMAEAAPVLMGMVWSTSVEAAEGNTKELELAPGLSKKELVLVLSKKKLVLVLSMMELELVLNTMELVLVLNTMELAQALVLVLALNMMELVLALALLLVLNTMELALVPSIKVLVTPQERPNSLAAWQVASTSADSHWQRAREQEARN